MDFNFDILSSEISQIIALLESSCWNDDKLLFSKKSRCVLDRKAPNRFYDFTNNKLLIFLTKQKRTRSQRFTGPSTSINKTNDSRIERPLTFTISIPMKFVVIFLFLSTEWLLKITALALKVLTQFDATKIFIKLSINSFFRGICSRAF